MSDNREQISSEEIYIPHHELLRLMKDGKASLGIGMRQAQEIADTPRLGPGRSTASSAFQFWKFAALGGFAFSIYASFAYDWWWFIIGFLALGVVGNSNNSANQENMIQAALADEEFYDRIAAYGWWVYKIAPEDALDFASQEPSAL